jgi:acetyl esterase/lipase
MKVFNIECPGFDYEASNKPFITAYIHDQFVNKPVPDKYPAIIICPGGGYRMLSERNQEPVALALLAEGYQVFVLNYSLVNQDETKPLLPTNLFQLGYLMKIIHQQSDIFQIDSSKISIMGFSAGGHLTAIYNGVYHNSWILENLDTTRDILKPYRIVLCYSVIGLQLDWPFNEERALKIADPALWNAQELVNPNSAPCFIWHTVEDERVGVINAIKYIESLHQQGISYEAHLYQTGEHGLSLANKHTAKYQDLNSLDHQASTWFKLAMNWLNKSI